MPQELRDAKRPLEINDDLVNVRVVLQEMVSALQKSPKKSRERSLVITKLEEAESWAIRASALE